ncbi:MAG: hypothetical protein Rhirs2KO_18580 [Rhizobiaceae bacterium]
MRASAPTELLLSARQSFGWQGSPSVETAIATVSVGTAWQAAEHTFTLPSYSGATVGAGAYTALVLSRPHDATNPAADIDLAGAQLAFGSEVPAFAPRNDEVDRCARRYQRHGINLGGGWVSDTSCVFNVSFPVPMIAKPNVGIVPGSAVNVSDMTAGRIASPPSIVWHDLTEMGGQFQLGGFSGAVVGRPAVHNAGGNYLYFEAPL